MAITVEERLYPLIADRFRRRQSHLTATTRFKRDLKGDTGEFFALILDVEAAFQIHLDDDDLALVENVGTLSRLIGNKLGVEVHEET